MSWLASIYWRQERWILKAVVSNRFFVALLRLETLVVWYATPTLLILLLSSNFAIGGILVWVLKALMVISLAWLAFGAFWLSFFFGYLVEAVSWNSPIATQHPGSDKRLKLLELRIGAA